MSSTSTHVHLARVSGMFSSTNTHGATRRTRVLRERTGGKTAYAIARDLNKDAVPTAQGCARLVALPLSGTPLSKVWIGGMRSRRLALGPPGRAYRPVKAVTGTHSERKIRSRRGRDIKTARQRTSAGESEPGDVDDEPPARWGTVVCAGGVSGEVPLDPSSPRKVTRIDQRLANYLLSVRCLSSGAACAGKGESPGICRGFRPAIGTVSQVSYAVPSLRSTVPLPANVSPSHRIRFGG
jgi:hypothetical protein